LPFCPKCGAEMPENAAFCPKCGTPVQVAGVVYRKDSTGWPVGRVFAFIFGGFILVLAMGLIMGGGAILWSQSALTDQAGYMITPPTRLNVASYAIVEDKIDITMNSGWMMNPSTSNIISLKVSVTSNDQVPIFVGIAHQQHAQNYLNNVNIDKLVSYSWTSSSSDDEAPVYETITGGAPSSPPTAQSFWVAKSSGAGTQSLTWTPTSGEYWVVVMNADGSKMVDVNAQVGARVTILRWVGWGLLIGGLLVALAGVAAIYFGAIRRS
jgi:hypothetical protein